MAFLIEYRAIWASLFSLIVLLALILKFKSNAFITLLGCAILAALLAGMSPDTAFKTVQNGMGGTLGFIATVIGLGAIFGAIMEQSGAIQTLAGQVDKVKGDGPRSMAAGLMGLIAAIPVFFDVALIILLPFIMNLAKKVNKKPLFFGLPLCAGLAIGHAFIPPTPGPIAIAELIGAKLGYVIVMGGLISVICLIISGPVLTVWLDKSGRLPGIIGGGPITLNHAQDSETSAALKSAISFPLALSVMLLPIILIILATIGNLFLVDGSVKTGLIIVGHPFSALIIACAASWFLLAPKTAGERSAMKKTLSRAFEPTAAVILVTGAGGAFKQVLVDTGAGADIANYFINIGLTPVLLAFTLALLLRVVQGSATVAMITAAGLIAPLIIVINPNPWQLAVLTTAIAAGATGFSHVNDSGFWLVSRLFNLTEHETLKSWTLSTGVISITGLLACLCLYGLVG